MSLQCRPGGAKRLEPVTDQARGNQRPCRHVSCRLFPIALVFALAAPGHAVPEGSPRAREAYTLCRTAERLAPADRLELLDRGVWLAEAAVAAATDAQAHFALFCTLGRRLLVTGFSLLRPLEPRRVLRELDATVRLAPDDPDVLTAKGAVLLELPGVLGGDVREGERWLRRALARDPGHCATRAYLRGVQVDDEGTPPSAC